MNGDRTLLITIFTFLVLIFGALLWFGIPLKLRDSLYRLRTMRFLANFYHSDLNEVAHLAFYFSSYAKQDLIFQRWLSSHLDFMTMASLERFNGFPFDPCHMYDSNMTLAEKKRREIPVGYERRWVLTGVSKAIQCRVTSRFKVERSAA